MGRQLGPSLLALLLLTVAVFAAVSGENEVELASGTSSDQTTNRTNLDATEDDRTKSTDRTLESSSNKFDEDNVDADEESGDEDEDEEDDEEDDAQAVQEEYDGEEEEDNDEYGDELRAVAESHEAMSRVEKNSNSTGRDTAEARTYEQKSQASQNFDSHERSVEAVSDEDEASNEAIVLKEKDEEVEELLRYKNNKQRSPVAGEALGESGRKRKRVPTVKKELSTQKEIHEVNETSEMRKRFNTKELLDELNRQLMVWSVKPTAPKEFSELNDLSKQHQEKKLNEVFFERAASESKIDRENKLPYLVDPADDFLTLDKRQGFLAKDFEADLPVESVPRYKKTIGFPTPLPRDGRYMPLEYTKDDVVYQMTVDMLLDLMRRLQYDKLGRYKRMHRLSTELDDELELSRRIQEVRRRDFEGQFSVTTPYPLMTTMSSPPVPADAPKKSRKKLKKKKKKKPRHRHYSTTTSTISPSISTLLTTTETPWPTTPMQWRLVAERLFGPPWPQNMRDDPNAGNHRFTSPSSPRTSSPVGNFGPQLVDTKQRESHKALNTERQALMLESSREYTQPRHLHYGKVNTHQKSSDGGRREPIADYEREPGRSQDYDSPDRSYQRFGQARVFSRGRSREEDFVPPESYAENHEYRPPGREYAASKSWQDARFKYGRPSWKTEERQNSGDKWAWRQSPADFKLWPQVTESKPWQNDRDYWAQLEGDDEKAWPPRGRSNEQQSWERMEAPNVWSPWSSPMEKSKGYDDREEMRPPWEKSKSRMSDREDPLKQQKQKSQEKVIVPKITMKTWNSLTSDPATWPFKLPGAKPWPKDQNGKSYNPNADLVRKLGLDKQGRLLSDKESSPATNYKNSYQPEKSSPEHTNSMPKSQEMDSGRNLAQWPVKMSEVKSWPKPGKPYGVSPQLSRALTTLRGAGRTWKGNGETGRKPWPAKTVTSPKIQSVSAWVMPADQSAWKPYNLKTVNNFDGDAEEQDQRRWSSGAAADVNERTWQQKTDDNSWPAKLNDNWSSFSKSTGAAAWPKWKQFAYHKVTAVPAASGGSQMNGPRSRNAFIAVSAVPSPKYSGNQWRKNDIEETPVARHSNSAPVDPDHPVSQLHAGVEPAIYTWKKDGKASGDRREKNATDPLEDQLEHLRRAAASWSHWENANNVKEQLSAISDASVQLASSQPANSSVEPSATKAPEADDDNVSPQPEGNKEIAIAVSEK